MDRLNKLTVALLLVASLVAPADGKNCRKNAPDNLASLSEETSSLPDKGSMFISSRSNLSRVQTKFGTVECEAGSTVFMASNGKSLAVFDLDSNSDEVIFRSGNHKIKLIPGMQVVVTADAFATFRSANPPLGIAYRNAKEYSISQGPKVFLAEFSIQNAFRKINQLKELADSDKPEDKKLVRRILKNAAILGPLSINSSAELNPSSSKATGEGAETTSPIPHQLQATLTMFRKADFKEEGEFTFDQVIDLTVPSNKYNPTLCKDVSLVQLRNGQWTDLKPVSEYTHEFDSPGVAAVISCSSDAFIKTHHGGVVAKEGSVLFVIDKKSSVAAYVIGSPGIRDVKFLVGNKSVRLRAGEQVISADKGQAPFERLCAFGVGHRLPRSCAVDAKNVYLADFSITSAGCLLPPMRRLLLSENRKEQKKARDILKSAAILQDITLMDGPFKSRFDLN